MLSPRFSFFQEEGDNAGASDQSDPSAAGPQKKTQRSSESASGEDGTPNGNASANGSAGSAVFPHEQELNMAGLACVVKLYDFREGHIKLNDTAEFVGVLGYDQSPPIQDETPTAGGGGGGGVAMMSRNPFEGLEDFSPKVPPPSLAPRLHCICEYIPRGAFCIAVAKSVHTYIRVAHCSCLILFVLAICVCGSHHALGEVSAAVAPCAYMLVFRSSHVLGHIKTRYDSTACAHGFIAMQSSSVLLILISTTLHGLFLPRWLSFPSTTTAAVYRKLPACDPLRVDPKQPKDALYALQGPLPFSSFMRDTKRQAIVHLAKALGGDVLAAEYLLLALLSRAYARTEVRPSWWRGDGRKGSPSGGFVPGRTLYVCSLSWGFGSLNTSPCALMLRASRFHSVTLISSFGGGMVKTLLLLGGVQDETQQLFGAWSVLLHVAAQGSIRCEPSSRPTLSCLHPLIPDLFSPWHQGA